MSPVIAVVMGDGHFFLPAGLSTADVSPSDISPVFRVLKMMIQE